MARPWGYWTEQKLEMLAEYLPRFTSASKRAGATIYLDLFAGDPENISKTTGRTIAGSARIALQTDPPFAKVRLFELPRRAARLKEELTREFPGRDLDVIAGDCNVTIDDALADLRQWEWAPTFALVDQYAAEVRWETLEKIARFRRGRTKAELWLLFAHSMLPRALSTEDPETIPEYATPVTQMYGTDEWLQAYHGWRDGILTPEQFRDELANLMRWRLERDLGYKITHAFEMKNTRGAPLYRMTYASDHDAGDRIMSHIYGRAAEKRPLMQAEAAALMQAQREAKGKVPQLSLFAPLPREVRSVDLYQHAPPKPPFQLPTEELP